LDRRVLDAHIAPHARSLEVAEGERDHARLLAARCAPRASSTPIKWLTDGQPLQLTGVPLTGHASVPADARSATPPTLTPDDRLKANGTVHASQPRAVRLALPLLRSSG